METKKESFSYTYSAQQQEEIKRIVQKYVPHEESKLEQLRQLDKNTTKPGTIASIAFGTVSTLVMGTGMSCSLMWTKYFFLGIILGVIGIIGIALAYPIYNRITRMQRKRIAPLIKILSDELMHQT